MGFALALGVGMAALAASIGLAPIVGAFLGECFSPRCGKSTVWRSPSSP